MHVAKNDFTNPKFIVWKLYNTLDQFSIGNIREFAAILQSFVNNL